MKAQLLLMMICLIFTANLIAQQVSGTVKDENGEALIGVTILEKGTTNGTVTDLDGHYTIQVSENASLYFSYIGFQSQEVLVDGKTSIDIILISGIELVEVIVLGYQEKSKEEVTGSVSVINSKLLDQVPIANLDNLLQGKAAGLMIQSGSGQPGSNATNVVIRGVTSISGNTAPYYLLDGVPINAADFSGLNPNDIASISVLKDASASIYGAQAANGVIVITSKKGEAGKTKIDFRTQFGMSLRPQDNVDLMNTAELLSFENYLASQGAGGGLGAVYGPDGSAPNPALLDSLRAIDTDFEEVILRKGLSHSYELAISGGTDQLKYYVSGNYFSQEGIVKNSDFTRGTFKASLGGELGKFQYHVGANVGYSVSNLPSSFTNADAGDGNIYQNPISGIYWGIPYESIYLEDGSFAPLLGAGGDNWVDQFENWKQSEKNLKIVGNARLSYELYRGLKVATNIGLDMSQLTTHELIPPNSLFGAQVNGNSGRLQNILTDSKDYIVTTTLSYRNHIGKSQLHLLDVLAGNELIRDGGNSFGYVAYSLNPKDLSGSGASETTTTPAIAGTFSSQSQVSLFLSGAYTFNNRYNFNAGFRRDASSVFGDNNKWGNFWNIGASWVASNESFLKGNSHINLLKLRASYGTLGNAGIPRTAKYTSYTSTSYNGNVGQVPNTIGDPNVKWEETKSANVGVDFELFKSKIRGSFDFYNKKTEAFFQQVDLSLTTGTPSLIRNAGTMRNRGIELSLAGDIYTSKLVTITARGNYAYNKNVVLDLEGVNEFETGYILVKEGLPFGSHFVVDYVGIDPATGAPLYKDDEGNVTTVFDINNRTTNHGSYLPVHTGNFGLDVSIQNFYASVDFNFMAGHTLLNLQLPQYSYDIGSIGIQNFLTDMLDIWTTPGQVTDIQGVIGGSALSAIESSRYIENGSFLRLKGIKLGYRITKVPGNMRYINVYAQAQNLYHWSAISGADPESWNNVSFYNYPNPRIITFGVDFGF
jgi:TonB-linked SusC/RagA family outer membrane protein